MMRPGTPIDPQDLPRSRYEQSEESEARPIARITFGLLLANVLLLASPSYAAHHVEAFVDRWHLTVVRDRTCTLATRAGETVTILVLDEPTVRVRTEGLAYPLRDEPLVRFSTRGVSNVAEGGSCTVAAAGGALLVLREWAH